MTSHTPNKGEQVVRYYGYFSNLSRGMRKLWDLKRPERPVSHAPTPIEPPAYDDPVAPSTEDYVANPVYPMDSYFLKPVSIDPLGHTQISQDGGLLPIKFRLTADFPSNN